MKRHERPEPAPDVAARDRRRGLRLLVRLACLFAAIAALGPLVPRADAPLWVPALSPFVAVARVLATRGPHAATWLGLIVGMAVLVRRRLWCRWCCPYGAVRYVFSETQYTLEPHIDPGKCTSCGACEAACPTEPNKAIVVVPRLE